MGQANIVMRNPNSSDARTIFNWRNDCITRKMSLNQHEIKWEQHKNWFSNAIEDKTIQFILVEDTSSGEGLSLIRFETHFDTAKVSIMVAPNHRGRGHAAKYLAQAIQKFLAKHIHTRTLIAVIRVENHASIKLFTNLGFVFHREDLSVATFHLELQKNSEHSK